MFFLSKILTPGIPMDKCFLSYKDDICYEFINLDMEISHALFITTQVGIYTNLTINFNQFEQIISSIKQTHRAITSMNVSTKICIDAFGINVGKLVHYGHMRTLIYGELMKIFYKFYGYRVFIDNHFGDSTTHIMHYCYILKSKGYTLEQVYQLDIYALHKIYAESKEVKIDLELEVVKEMLINIHIPNKYENYVRNHIIAVSKEYALFIMNFLNITSEYMFYESRYIDLCKYLLLWGLDNNLFKYDEYKRLLTINGIVLTNNSGIPLYAFTDIAAIVERNLYHMSNIYYVVDKRQYKHFEMLFEFAKYINPNIKLNHIKYGYVYDMQNNIMSSRKGAIVDIKSTFLDLSNKGYSNKAIRLGFIFYETRHRIASDYVFVERMLIESIEEANKFISKIKEIKHLIPVLDINKNILSHQEKLVLTRCVQMYEATYMSINDQNLDRIGSILQELKKCFMKISTNNISYRFCILFVQFMELLDILY